METLIIIIWLSLVPLLVRAIYTMLGDITSALQLGEKIKRLDRAVMDRVLGMILPEEFFQ